MVNTLMKMSFREFLKLVEGGLFMNPPIQDNPGNPGTKRKDAKNPYLHRFGSAPAVQQQRMKK